MSDEKELEVQQDDNQVAVSQDPDYLQEQSDLVKNIKPKSNNIDVLEDKNYSEQYEKNAQEHMNSVKEQLSKMRENKEYGEKEIIDGKEVQGDMEFLESEENIPEELREKE